MRSLFALFGGVSSLRTSSRRMTMSLKAPHGSWKSPVTAVSLTESTVGLSNPTPAKDAVYWLEARPSEAGRCVIVRRDAQGGVTDAIPSDHYCRTKVHEYGGGAWVLDERGEKTEVIYSNFADQRLYKTVSGAAVALTALELPAGVKSVRYADGAVDAARGLLYCICETHLEGGAVENTIVAVPLDGSLAAPMVLASGSDFYAAPRLSPSGGTLAYLKWDHPNMPWDATQLVTVQIDVAGGAASKETVVAGANGDTSVIQPAWAPGGDLHFISDETGYYNVYASTASGVVNRAPKKADFGGSAPGWALGQQAYTFDGSKLVATYESDVGTVVVVVDGAEATEHCGGALPRGVGSPKMKDGTLYFMSSAPDQQSAVARCVLGSETEKLKLSSTKAPLAPEFVSTPELIEFDTVGGRAFGHYYAPKNPNYAENDEAPPLLVKAHGGPTACASTAYSLAIQFWTTRGFAVVDVDYRGSTGYGRDYRRLLRGNWGVHDVDDCCAAAQHLVATDRAHADKLCIDGGSAGGFTTLGALAWKDVFAAGCSKYGVGDLAVLAADTHKFESRYLDRLVGKWPEEAALYKGADDKIVPPNQAILMHDALKAKGIPTALKIYEGEAHGFRKSDNIQDAINAELYFFSKVFSFPLDDPNDVIPSFPIDNLAD